MTKISCSCEKQKKERKREREKERKKERKKEHSGGCIIMYKQTQIQRLVCCNGFTTEILGKRSR